MHNPPLRRALRLLLLSHAATSATRRAAFANDEPADADSLSAAARASPRLPADARILASPAVAAQQTAAALGHAPQLEPALRDADWGRWRGRTLDEITAAEPNAVAAWLADPDVAPHGGESLAQLQRRTALLLAPGHDRTTLAVTHPAILRAALLHALGAPAASFWRIDVPPLATLELGWNGRAWTLRRFATIPT